MIKNNLKINNIAKNAIKERWGYFFILPAIGFFAMFVLWPFLSAIKMGFYDLSIDSNQFIGFKNYILLFKDSTFIQSLWITLKFVIIVVPVNIVLALIISTVVYDRKSGIVTFVRATFYLPSIISSVCIAIVWKWLYNPGYGLFNKILTDLGMQSVDFLGDYRIAIYSLMAVVISWSIGQPIILFIAALGGIPISLYEAASIDGATWFRQFRHISLPLLKPVILYNFIIQTISVMQVVEVIMLMTEGGPFHSTSSMLYLIYENAFKLNKYGYAAAIGNIMFVIIFLLSIVQFKCFSSDVEN